jgi:hypothetical protein
MMDDIVAQSLRKWPDVPHCYGWLALDARGNWRMRDQRAQDCNLPGDKIAHSALIGFINRNYNCDAQGRWYFQNGPQRVYVNLETAPYIARTDPQHGFALHTGTALERIDAAWLSESGRLLLAFSGENGLCVAALDDRDLAQCLPTLHIAGTAGMADEPVDDAQLTAWLAGGGVQLAMRHRGRDIPLQHIAQADIAAQFNFVLRPQPD